MFGVVCFLVETPTIMKIKSHQFSSIICAKLMEMKPKKKDSKWPRQKKMNWQFWKSQLFWVGHFDFSTKNNLSLNQAQIRPKLWDRMNGTQFLWLHIMVSSQKQPTPNIFWGSVFSNEPRNFYYVLCYSILVVC